MKKIIPFVLILIVLTACDDSNPVTITTSTSVSESVEVVVPQTNGTPHTTDQTVTEDLSSYITNLSDVTQINIDALTYKFSNASGNSNAVIQNASLTINGVTIAAPTNINITQEATNETVFSISDEAILNQIETLILNSNSVTIQYTSSTLSDEGSITFDVEISIQITATLT